MSALSLPCCLCHTYHYASRYLVVVRPVFEIKVAAADRLQTTGLFTRMNTSDRYCTCTHIPRELLIYQLSDPAPSAPSAVCFFLHVVCPNTPSLSHCGLCRRMLGVECDTTTWASSFAHVVCPFPCPISSELVRLPFSLHLHVSTMSGWGIR